VIYDLPEFQFGQFESFKYEVTGTNKVITSEVKLKSKDQKPQMQEPELITFKVGELKAKEFCKVSVTYLEQLKTLKNKFWRFRFRDKLMPCVWA